jgi:AraC family transcriptional regulator
VSPTEKQAHNRDFGRRPLSSRRPLSDRPIGRSAVVLVQTSEDRVDLFERVSTSATRSEDFVITRTARESIAHGMTDCAARLESFVACVPLRSFAACEIWKDEQYEEAPAIEAGTMHINDMRYSWRANIQCPFDVINFCIPRTFLEELTLEEGQCITELHCPMRALCVDPVMKNFAHALLPALGRARQTNGLFIDHAARAITAHLAESYGSIRLRPQVVRGGLAPWQEKRAKELLRANLGGDLSVKELAATCQLSSGYFTRAFKQTVGCAPHQWLVHQRVELAKQLMLNTDDPLCEIALATGFVDQSHFTRVFSQYVNRSPAVWRSEQSKRRSTSLEASVSGAGGHRAIARTRGCGDDIDQSRSGRDSRLRELRLLRSGQSAIDRLKDQLGRGGKKMQ